MNKKVFILLCILLTISFGDSRYKKIKDSSKLVVLIHGIIAHPYSMWKFENKLSKEGYSVLNFDYASTKLSMDSVIIELEHEISKYENNYNEIYFVTHSLGSFVARQYLHKNQNKKFMNITLIAPPSKGSIVAERFENFPLFKWLYGEAGQKLGKGYDDYWREFPAPNIPFGIIAGGIGTKHGLSPMIPGDDDGTVGVQETIIEGYKDFIIIPGLHSSLLWQNEVINQTLYFMTNMEFKRDKRK